MKFSSSVYAKAAAVALALAAAGTATVAQARSDVFFSVGANVAPGVAIGVSNAPVYYPPVYVQPHRSTCSPRRSTTATATAPVVLRAPAPVYYGAGTGLLRPARHWQHHRHWTARRLPVLIASP